MSRFRKSAVLAVVALGLVALAAPAAAPAKNSSITRLNKDVDRLGKNVNDLRKKTDEMNNTIASLAKTAGSALTQLQAGLTTLANTTANFKYGVVQVASTGAPLNGLDGVGPTHFFATPPLYKTGEQSTVTFPIPDLVNAGAASGLKLLTAVRSVNPDSGSVSCRILIQKNNGALGATDSSWTTLRQGTKDGIFVKMPQSRIEPQNGNKNFPVALIPTEDNVLDLADPQYMATLLSVAGGTPFQQRASSAGGVTGTLSCIVS